MDHTPRVHPESAEKTLPSSFAAYRVNATTHGPLGGKGSNADRQVSVAPGEYALRNELPKRFQYEQLTEAEIETIMTGGAATVF